MANPRARVIGCSAVLALAAAMAAIAQAPPPPTGLSAQVAGNVVTAFWNPSPGAVNYLVQVGTAPGASNLFSGTVGNTTTASGAVPPGTYFWRVMAIGPSGAASGPSAEDQFTVGSGGCVPPGPPQNFTFSVAGARVMLRWAPPASGSPPTAYVIEAGSAPGLANLFVGSIPGAPPETAVDAPSGTYFVRLRAQNACGLSGVSSEQVITVGGGNQPPPPPPTSCVPALTPAVQNVPAAGGVFELRVDTAAQCNWSVTSLTGFVSIVSAGLQRGTDVVRYLVAPNTDVASRAGAIRITSQEGSRDMSVSQEGVGPLTARFVMREGAQEVTICQVNEGGPCSLDGSSSSPADQIVSYQWRTVRFALTGEVLREDSYSGVNPLLDLGCTEGGNTQEQFTVTLTIANSAGQTSTLTRQLSLIRAGCGT